MIEAHHLSNLAVLMMLICVGGFALWLRRDATWRALSARLWRQRRGALIVAGLYLLVGGLDSISWVGGRPAAGAQGDLVAQFQPRSV
ncbi:MAG: hypothetical protein ABI629_26835, partial [bacterium]